MCLKCSKIEKQTVSLDPNVLGTPQLTKRWAQAVAEGSVSGYSGIRGFGVDSLESGLSKFHVIAAGKHLFIFTAGRFPFSFSISIFETNILMLHAGMTMKEEEEKLYVLWWAETETQKGPTEIAEAGEE